MNFFENFAQFFVLSPLINSLFRTSVRLTLRYFITDNDLFHKGYSVMRSRFGLTGVRNTGSTVMPYG